jgi:signal transduction histidine kinase
VRSRDLDGTGPGLAIVKHLSRAHGGEVSVHSSSGEGITFVIELPAEPSENPRVPTANSVAARDLSESSVNI